MSADGVAGGLGTEAAKIGLRLSSLIASCRRALHARADAHPLPSQPSAPPSPADDMAPRYRHSLQEKLEMHAPAFRMSDVTFKSFQLQASGQPGRLSEGGGRLCGAGTSWLAGPPWSAPASASHTLTLPPAPALPSCACRTASSAV